MSILSFPLFTFVRELVKARGEEVCRCNTIMVSPTTWSLEFIGGGESLTPLHSLSSMAIRSLSSVEICVLIYSSCLFLFGRSPVFVV